jgi:hypothetical protein
MRPVKTSHLFLPLNRELVACLHGLRPADWEAPTSAGTWRVRELVAHLLHGDLRELSAKRNGHPYGRPAPSFAELVGIIDADNADGVAFLATLAPGLLTDLVGFTGPKVARLFASLSPEGRAATNVAWAGESESVNWTDVGREYTERWHHQMQIRDAVGAGGLTERRWIAPVLRLSILALRRAYERLEVPVGTAVVLRVTGNYTHAWSVVQESSGWDVRDGASAKAAATVRLDAEVAGRSFFELPIPAGLPEIEVIGDEALARPVLSARSVMIASAVDPPRNAFAKDPHR